ncbi:ATP-binding cassette domain-containing protein, partial [bacterium]|nr:ATP-binding cassette domain-containing protein [bacterium]
MTAEPVLQVKNIHKAFGDRKILEGVSFDVYAGEMLGLIGPSGCGKSTLLKIICGLLAPDQGEVIRRSDDIGLVFQGSALLNSLTVRNNLAL